MDQSTRMNKLQSGPPRHGQILTMTEIKLRFFFAQQLQFAWLCSSCRDWWHQTCPPFHTRKRDVPASSNSTYITWAPSVSCCLRSGPPVSRLGNLHTPPSETEELLHFLSQGPRHWHSTTECQKRRACVLCCKPQGSLPRETARVSYGDSYYRASNTS